MSRIDKIFANLKAENRKAFSAFLMAGDPDEATTLSLMESLADNVDFFEIGIPFTDPMADGPIVQAAGLRALSHGMNVQKTFSLVQQFRSKNATTPVILMGYFNPVLRYGIDKFMNDCNELGVDGIIIVDIPPEEDFEIYPKAQQNNIALIRLVTPTTDAKRLAKILPHAGGFLYYVSIAGVTGTASADPTQVGQHIADVKKHTGLPVIVGFGIKTPEDAKAMAAMADGVIVGSAIIQTLAENLGDSGLASKVGTQVAALAAAVRDVK